MKKKITGKVLLDFEFTGLDNEYSRKHKIISISFLSLETGKSEVRYYSGGEVKMSIGAMLKTGITSEDLRDNPPFSKEEFWNIFDENCEFYGFGVSTDIQMLRKYDININYAGDIQERMRLTEEYEKIMATEGCSFECCYYMVFDEIFDKLHSGTNEVDAMKRLYDAIVPLHKGQYLNIVPYGRFAGMEIQNFIEKERKSADGYRYNNYDLFSESIDYWIELIEYEEECY